jgi:hypothetical protein
MAELSFRVDIDGNGFAKVRKLGKDFNDADKSARKMGKSVGFLSGEMGKLAGLVTAGSILKLGKDALGAAAELEKLELQFKPILGSAEEAKERIDELSKFAARTPFELPEIARASKTLETLTGGALSTGKALAMVGDAAAVSGENFADLSVHVGRAFSNLQANRAAGESISRLQELGLVSGQTRNEIELLQKAGRGKEAWEILKGELESTEGAMEGLSETFNGKLSTLADNWRLFTADFAEKSGVFDFAKVAVDGLTKSLQFLSSQELEGEFDKMVEGMPALQEALKEVEAQEKKDLARKKELAEAEAKARAEKIKSEKLELDLQNKRRDRAIKEAQKERERLEREKQSELELFVKAEMQKAEAIANLQLELKERDRQRKFDEFELARQDEIADHQTKMSMLKGFYESEEQQRLEHSQKMKAIEEAEEAHIKQTEQAKRLAKQQTVEQYAGAVVNILKAGQTMLSKNKGLARAEIMISGAVATANALKTDPFFPVGLSMGVLAGVKTLEALRQVDQAKAFVGGGVVGGGEQYIRVNERGAGRPEAVLNSSATSALGRETIDLINNGRLDALERRVGGDRPQISINVNGVLSRDVYENEIKPMMAEDALYR